MNNQYPIEDQMRDQESAWLAEPEIEEEIEEEEDEDASYKIIRMYQREELPDEIVKKGLTLHEARAWCKDPETSGSKCTTQAGIQRTWLCGMWFDGYDEE